MKRLFGGLVIVFLAAACGGDDPGDTGSSRSTFANGDPEYALLAAGNWSQKQDNAVVASGGVVIWKDTNVGVGAASSADPNFLAKVQATNAFLGAAADPQIQWTPGGLEVEAEAAGLINPNNDPYYYYGYQWNMAALQANKAWAAGCTGAGVRVAIVDGAVMDTHPDIQANVDVAYSRSFVPGWSFNQEAAYGFWHGTHVAGIVAAVDNTVGTVGVAPKATIIGVKALHGGSGSFNWIIRGILYAATPKAAGGAGAHIINMSLGADLPRSCKFPDGKSPSGCALLVAAMNRAVTYAMQQGTLVISAAGNSAIDFDQAQNLTTVPAESGNGIAVSATGPLGYFYGATNFRDLAYYSNYGTSLVWVAAPGGNAGIRPDPKYTYDLVLAPGGINPATGGYGYWFAQGTSMAAPAATGVAAILKQRYPNATPGLLKNLLASTADDEGKVGVDPKYGRGFVNAYNACTK